MSKVSIKEQPKTAEGLIDLLKQPWVVERFKGLAQEHLSAERMLFLAIECVRRTPALGWWLRGYGLHAAVVWIGWLEFAGRDSTMKTGEETSQPTREAVAYWASSLEPIYLEGALRRAIG